MTSGGDFPLFASAYFAAPEPLQPRNDQNLHAPLSPPSTSRRGGPEEGRDASPRKAAAGRLGRLIVGDSLPRLNVLEGLPRLDDGPLTELRARKAKLAFFEQQCSWVGDCLYVGSEAVARSRETLAASGITHVVNCVGFLYPPYFEGELAYKTLYLQDTPGEDILCIMYDVFDFIQDAGESGRVLVHCSQGVSRSASLAIAYLMWKQGTSYDETFSAVKARRGVANPNIGFICQLLQWHKRRNGGVDCCRLYRIAPQSASAPQYLVPKPVAAHGPAALDPRGAFVLQTPDALIVWVGMACPDAFATAGERFARQLVRYEGAAGPPTRVRQGAEPPAFWAAFTPLEHSASSGAIAAQAAEQAARSDDAAEEAAAAALGGGGDGEEAASRVSERAEYDRDYELYHRSLTARSGGDSGNSARSGKKTPRDEPGGGGTGAPSPNDRQRKHARGGEQQQQQQQQQQVGRQDATTSQPFVAGTPLTRSRSRSPCKSPCKSPSRNRRLSRRQSALLERGTAELERGISMDSAQQAVERTEQQIEALEAAEHAPSPLLRAASDVTPPRDGSLTARGTAADEQQQQQVAGGGMRPAVPRINLQRL